MESRASQEIDAIIGNATDWRGEMLSRLRGIVMSASPALVEEVKWKKPSRPEGVPVWSAGGIVCIGEMLKNAVRLTFPKGAQLSDPNRLFNARLTSLKSGGQGGAYSGDRRALGGTNDAPGQAGRHGHGHPPAG